MMREEMSCSGEEVYSSGENRCMLREKCRLLERNVEFGGQNVLHFAGSKAAFCWRKRPSLGGKVWGRKCPMLGRKVIFLRRKCVLFLGENWPWGIKTAYVEEKTWDLGSENVRV